MLMQQIMFLSRRKKHSKWFRYIQRQLLYVLPQHRLKRPQKFKVLRFFYDIFANHATRSVWFGMLKMSQCHPHPIGHLKVKVSD